MRLSPLSLDLLPMQAPNCHNDMATCLVGMQKCPLSKTAAHWSVAVQCPRQSMFVSLGVQMFCYSPTREVTKSVSTDLQDCWRFWSFSLSNQLYESIEMATPLLRFCCCTAYLGNFGTGGPGFWLDFS